MSRILVSITVPQTHLLSMVLMRAGRVMQTLVNSKLISNREAEFFHRTRMTTMPWSAS